MAVGERLLEISIILCEPLVESLVPFGPSPHPQRVIRPGKQEKDLEQNVI
jgi:hypothetical protein